MAKFARVIIVMLYCHPYLIWLGLVLFCVTSPNVAKASTVLTARCCFRLDVRDKLCQCKFGFKVRLHMRQRQASHIYLVTDCCTCPGHLGRLDDKIASIMCCVTQGGQVMKGWAVVDRHFLKKVCQCKYRFKVVVLNSNYSLI